MADHLSATTSAIEALIDEAGGVDRLITPRGWPHLGLVIIDAVFSLQADYDTMVQPLLERYCDSAPDMTWATASAPLPPEPALTPYEKDYRWLVQVYESLKPPSGNGKLLWHALDAKTIELIHQNVTVQAVRDDLETLVMDADVMNDLLNDPETKIIEIEIKITGRLRKGNGPKFIELSQRLEALRLKHEQGLLASIDFLKNLLELAKDVVEAEKEVPDEVVEDQGKAALTELFGEVKNSQTPVIVERVVQDIDEIVRQVRFPGWQQTAAGEREVQKALRRSLLKYKLHSDQDLFDRAYGYIVQYY